MYMNPFNKPTWAYKQDVSVQDRRPLHLLGILKGPWRHSHTITGFFSEKTIYTFSEQMSDYLVFFIYTAVYRLDNCIVLSNE